MDISKDCVFIPAHIWTPWFSTFGSKSGFDSFKDCFGEMSKYIFAVETGLSSDPKMNFLCSQLDDLVFVSNSDAHSLDSLGREANVFHCEKRYDDIFKTIKEKASTKFLYTIECYPQEGKYFYDGHGKCQVSFHPNETKKLNGICPVCKRPLTIGVYHRVLELADRKESEKTTYPIASKYIISLS